jgi:hypothetical protein
VLKIDRTSARAQFSGCISTTNADSETGQIAVCCQNLTLGALNSRSALSLLFGALFKKFGLFLNAPRMTPNSQFCFHIEEQHYLCLSSNDFTMNTHGE